MRRIVQVLVLSTVIGASVAGIASAAGSPAVATGGATKIGNSTAVLNGTVNPNGHATEYDFTYGPTTAYGATTTLHKVKAGTKAVAVSITVSGLTPGTQYHYRIQAVSSGGAVVGADRTFTTTGHPPRRRRVHRGTDHQAAGGRAAAHLAGHVPRRRGRLRT